MRWQPKTDDSAATAAENIKMLLHSTAEKGVTGGATLGWAGLGCCFGVLKGEDGFIYINCV